MLPALVYVLIVKLAGSEGLHGWGAVVGTDTAFMLGTLAICSGLLIPDTDLGENPRRERGV
ncbi:Na+/H+ antiporter NhaA [Pseudomonas aeruginosa]|uniref:Na+/H+ antiporter NhaA n=1 Tax=Pseudomonas aeruginosa TaxID=287 RepID=UPI001D0B3EC2|nr:Na+/H+ antiporter NhaA [Pseudomonas aeruginosa]MCC0119892.1 Na+/H+ antiporter NhaA [Pseudomonas aeruginosa]MCC0511398.1 Na+/H+ antiporter NhaA [Pseudomonas aeruginosa]